MPLRLNAFLPYRLSVLSNTVSRSLARTYQQRFGLTVPEWRVMAILGSESDLSALEIVERSAMDKVAVSRAVARLTERRLVAATGDSGDRRRRRLALTGAGIAIYDEVVPLAKDYEQGLLESLTAAEREALSAILHRMQDRAHELDATR